MTENQYKAVHQLSRLPERDRAYAVRRVLSSRWCDDHSIDGSRMAEALIRGFSWGGAVGGSDYWQSLHERYRKIENGYAIVHLQYPQR